MSDSGESTSVGGDEDFKLVLARRVTPLQAFYVLVICTATGALASIAAKTGQWWIGFLILGLALTIAWMGRRTVTRDVTRKGALWTLPPDRAATGRHYLDEVTQKVAQELGISDENRVRADVFAPDDTGHLLYMVPELTVRMTEAEKTLRIPEGFGVSGTCFANRMPLVASGGVKGGVVKGADGVLQVSSFWIGERESSKLAPELSWIITAPVCDQQGNTIGTLSVDGLEPPSNSHGDSEDDQLFNVMHHVVDTAALLGNLVPSS